MSIWSAIGDTVSRWLSLNGPEKGRASTSRAPSGERVTDDTLLSLSGAWACVGLIAGTVGSLPIEIYRTDAKGVRKVDKQHPLYTVLARSPNAEQTALDFWEFMAASIEMRGNAYAKREYLGRRLVALVPVRPQIMCVRRTEAGPLEYSWTDRGVYNRVGPDEMLHIRGYGGAPEGGLSTLAYGFKAFGLAQAIDRAAATTFSNGVRPSGALKVKQQLKKAQRDELEDLLQDKFVGAVNAGRPMLLDGDASWEQLSISPEDAQMLESRGFSIEEICRFFGVPPIMVGHGDKTSSWGTGVAEVTQGFVKYTLRRRLKRIEQALEKQLLNPADIAAGIEIEFNIDALLRGDAAARANFYQIMTRNGIMTVNECRALEGLAPVEGGDVVRVQAQNVAITDAPQMGHNGGPPLEDAA